MAAVPEFPDDLATLWFLVHRVAGLMDRAGEAVFRRELGISLAQFLVLSVVDAYPGDLNQQAIADRLGLTKGTVSRQIDHAVAAGLMTVQVSARTRRENHIALTPGGQDLVRRGDALYRDAQRDVFPAIDDADMAAALRVLGDLNASLDAIT
jgi:DNA-binding MarR family transcriptional regulator